MKNKGQTKPPATHPGPKAPPNYTVKTGDTWATIAARLKTSVGALLKANPYLKSLSGGQVVKVPGFGYVPMPAQPQQPQGITTLPDTSQRKTPPPTTGGFVRGASNIPAENWARQNAIARYTGQGPQLDIYHAQGTIADTWLRGIGEYGAPGRTPEQLLAQINAGIRPKRIGMADMYQLELSPQEMREQGYVQDPDNAGSWIAGELLGIGAGGNQGGYGGYSGNRSWIGGGYGGGGGGGGYGGYGGGGGYGNYAYPIPGQDMSPLLKRRSAFGDVLYNGMINWRI